MGSATEGKATSFLWDSKSLGPDVFIRMPTKSRDKMKGPQAYVSFGDEGTTASVNAFGHIMQISQFADYGSSGFVCVDAGYERPYYVTDRMRDLMKAATDPENGLRLDLVDWRQFHNVPSLGYMYDRWPRFIYDQKPASSDSARNPKTAKPSEEDDKKTDKASPILAKSGQSDQKALDNSAQSPGKPAFPLSIQYFCYKGTIVQKYLINLGGGGLSYDQVKWGNLQLTPEICIRDLDFVNYETFDEDLDSSTLTREVISKNTLAISYDILSSDSAEDDESPQKVGTEEQQLTAALFISPFVNGQAANIEEGNCIRIADADCQTLDNSPKRKQLEITITYVLKVLPQSTMKELRSLKNESTLQMIKAKEIMEAMDDEFQERSKFRRIYFSQNPQLDLAYRRHLEHILSVCCIPLSKADAADSKADDAELKTGDRESKGEDADPKAENGDLKAEDAGPKADDADSKASDANSNADDADSRAEDTVSKADYAEPYYGVAVATAITCGDISGHRIGPRASLSAIQFLKAMLTYLSPYNESRRTIRARNKKANIEMIRQPPIEKEMKPQMDYKDDQPTIHNLSDLEPEDDDACTLYLRVKAALEGHIRWLCEKAESDSVGEGTFATHYWPTGSAIRELSFLSPPSLVDTPIQLIKVLIYLGNRKRWDVPGWICTGLEKKARIWLKDLHDSNKHATYAFPRRSRNSDNYYNGYEESSEVKFSLTDHVMVAMAAKCVEKLLPPVQDEIVRSQSSETVPHQPQQSSCEQPQLSPSEQYQCYYAYKDVKRQILKHFTTENPVTKQRTLSTSRWSDKTRFLLHSKDTFLFFAVHEGFFEKSDKASKNTEHPKKNSKIDPFAELWRRVDERWTRLLEVQSYHDELQRFDWSNPLWCAIAFILSCKGKRVGHQLSEIMATEVRRVLLQNASANGIFSGAFGPDRTPAMFDHEWERDNYWFTTFELPYVLWAFDNLGPTNIVPSKQSGSSLAAPSQSEPQSFNKDVRGIGQQVEKRVLFDVLTSTKDQAGLVVLSDDWLLDPPKVMGFEQETEPNSREKLSIRATGIVIDIPRYSWGDEISISCAVSDNILDRLADRRSRWKSKKRIIWLPHCDQSTTENCLTASPEIEKKNISLFLARHSKQDIYFFDSATAALNKWETQLHLSFYRVSKDREGSLHSLDGINFLASTTVSFHFTGDFSDRFWTCYLLEDGTDVDSRKSLGTRLCPSEESGIHDNLKLTGVYSAETPAKRGLPCKYSENRVIKPWQQRRVLELLIYSKMLGSMHENSKGIFNEIRKLALNSKWEDGDNVHPDPFERSIREAQELRKLANEDHYFSVASRWRDLAQIMLVIEGNLSLNLERVNEWRRREKDRRNHQPRWTKEDEKNHRTTILRLEVFTERQARDIELLLDDIKKFRESLLRELETIRDDLSFRGSQNINLFTYVTIVFLPLGFATGVLSMSGRPQPEVLSSLYTLALAALGTTIFALLNAKTVKALVTPLAEGYGKARWLMWWLITFAFFHLVAKHAIRHSEAKKDNTGSSWARRWSRWYNIIKDFEISKAMTKEREKRSKAKTEEERDKKLRGRMNDSAA
ncbi:hypothetical protein FB567DRAFT_529354 [Paraphoma chrysanthemicola]|uniref:Mg2+ transporter zinc transport protein n=1 Tax=Paraphoma chrysanthemicola TaxID=798071 RepID=A0A8K0R385_9PLEO|nr:hypothetical protein FB567DRAFT_529354 [Paraphoma chrysanthemicola]